MNQNRIKQIYPVQDKTDRVLYLMHNAFRLNDNHSLQHALQLKNRYKELLILLISPNESNQRNSDYFQHGISNYQEALQSLCNESILLNRDDETLKDHILKSDHIVMDMPYLKEEKALFETVKQYAKTNQIALDLVETNVVVPVTITSDKEEYSARTIRSKIWSKARQYLDDQYYIDSAFTYEQKAREVLEEFIELKLENYHLKNNPELDYTSNLSVYLKYGFISPITIYKEMQPIDNPNKESFIEELVVRRELSYNFVYYNDRYDQFDGMTYQWAYQTMDVHLFDEREYLYTIDDYIHFKTHDPYFNTAMKEMVILGRMHGYMRMYWAKKVIEWSKSYQEAYQTLIYLNNHYFLDGNTPNGYTGVAWCFGKHDRAWTERQVFGKIRYMNQNGLKRKFDIDSYVKKINQEVSGFNE